MKVYLAGPMRGIPHFNFPAFHSAAEYLREQGYDVVSPAEMDQGDPLLSAAIAAAGPPWDNVPGYTFMDFMLRDLRALDGVEGIVLLPGWGASRGAHVELAYARATGKIVMTYHPYAAYGARTVTLDDGALGPSPSTDAGGMQTFATGATRSASDDKLDYEGFLSPIVLRRYAQYMHANRVQRDGRLRASDNWQKGMPRENYRKSMIRHLMDFWIGARGFDVERPADLRETIAYDENDILCAILFNVMGHLHENLKESFGDFVFPAQQDDEADFEAALDRAFRDDAAQTVLW
jgi:hypothetical protein